MNGAVSLCLPIGLAFVAPPPARELQEAHGRQMAVVRAHAARVLQVLEAAPPPPTGGVHNCSDDPVLLARAAAVAKSVMDGSLQKTCSTCGSLSYSAFVVHVLECQSVGRGKIYKAAVTAANPVSGARDAGHVTFFDSLFAPPPDFQAAELDAYGNPLLPATDDDHYVAPGEPSTSPPPGGKAGTDTTAADARRRRARALSEAAAAASATSGSSTAVLDSVIVPGSGSGSSGSDTSSSSDSSGNAVAPGTNAAPLTNQNAVIDIFGMVLSQRAQILLVQSAVIIVGTFLLTVIVTIF